jgi:hypothetical protein
MADTHAFFEQYMPEKIQSKPDLWSTVKASYQFDITGDGGGTWTVDLSSAPGSVIAGTIASPGCIITVARTDWEKLLDTPSLGMQLFMSGKLKASNVALALQLQKILA